MKKEEFYTKILELLQKECEYTDKESFECLDHECWEAFRLADYSPIEAIESYFNP